MDKNKIRGIAALAIVLVVYNVLAFAIPFPKNGCFWAAWVFGLVAILAQAAFLLLAFQHGEGAKSKFYGFPVARVGVVYLCVQLALSFLFMGLAFVKCPAWIPVVLSVILLAAAALGLIVTTSAMTTAMIQARAATWVKLTKPVSITFSSWRSCSKRICVILTDDRNMTV